MKKSMDFSKQDMCFVKANWEIEVHGKEQMQQSRETVPVVQVRRQASALDEEQRRSGYIVTHNVIIIKAKAVATELQITGFLASKCWCTKFLWRKNQTPRQKTKTAQTFPEDLDQITNFYSLVVKSSLPRSCF